MKARLRGLLDGPAGPYLVLAAAVLFPGAGHVIVGAPRRGLIMQMFIISCAFVTWHLTTPETSLVGRLAGGIFVYAMSVPEAYRLAKRRAVLAAAAKATPKPDAAAADRSWTLDQASV